MSAYMLMPDRIPVTAEQAKDLRKLHPDWSQEKIDAEAGLLLRNRSAVVQQ
jgi:hypothetical protein